MVRACYSSLVRHFGNYGYDVKVIDEKNWREYIDLPDYIIRRRERKQIPPAHFADLLRLELLIKYGGTWIDSTVLCTGEAVDGLPLAAYLEADLFMFQYTQPGGQRVGWHRELVYIGLLEQRGAGGAAGYAVCLLAGARCGAGLLSVPPVLRYAAGGVSRADCSDALRICSPQPGAGDALGRAVRRGEVAAACEPRVLPQADVYAGQGAGEGGGDVL